MYHGFYIRDTCGDDQRLLAELLNRISKADLNVPQEAPIREYVLHIMFKIYQRKGKTSLNKNSDFEKNIERVLNQHIARLKAA